VACLITYASINRRRRKSVEAQFARTFAPKPKQAPSILSGLFAHMPQRLASPGPAMRPYVCAHAGRWRAPADQNLAGQPCAGVTRRSKTCWSCAPIGPAPDAQAAENCLLRALRMARTLPNAHDGHTNCRALASGSPGMERRSAEPGPRDPAARDRQCEEEWHAAHYRGASDPGLS